MHEVVLVRRPGAVGEPLEMDRFFGGCQHTTELSAWDAGVEAVTRRGLKLRKR